MSNGRWAWKAGERLVRAATTLIERGVWETTSSLVLHGACPTCHAPLPGRWANASLGLLDDQPTDEKTADGGIVASCEFVAHLPDLIDAAEDQTCPHHSPIIGAIDRSSCANTSTVGQLLSVVPDDAEPLTWTPFSCPGTCHNCAGRYDFGHQHRGTTGTCPHCGHWLRTQRSQRLRDASLAAALFELGIAPEEILPIRTARGGYQWLRLTE